MSSELRYSHKSGKRSPSYNRDESYKKKKYDRDPSEDDFKVKRERSYDSEYQRASHHNDRRPEENFDGSRRRHKHSHRSERHHSSSHRKLYVKDELPDMAGGEWEREEKYKDPISLKTEPVSDEDLNVDVKPELPVETKVGPVVKKDESENWSKDEPPKPEQKETVNLGLSGKLTEDANTYNGVVITYSQPPEARKPKRRWRWYIFKDDQDIPFLPLHRQSAYLIGRNRKVADIPVDHPSCSKQHAVLQYRLVSYTRTDGSTGRTVKPYIIDLESANGTYVNTKRINPKQYYELFERDVVKFGFSSREYVLLHEGSKGSDNEGADSGPELSPVSMLKS